MNENPSTLGMRAGGNAIPSGLLQHVQDQADRARAALGDGGRHHIPALDTLANYLAGCDVTDQRFWALWLMAGATGDSDRFVPGDLQTTLLARLGTAGRPPRASICLYRSLL